MEKKQFSYFGVRFLVFQIDQKWACNVPYWYYQDDIESISDAINIAENYIEKNYKTNFTN